MQLVPVIVPHATRMTPAVVFAVAAQIRDLNKKVDRLVTQVELDKKAAKKALERRELGVEPLTPDALQQLIAALTETPKDATVH